MPILELVYLLRLFIIKVLHTVKGYEIIYLNKECPISANAIYAFNHSCCLNIPVAFEVVKRHCYIMIGVQDLEIVDKLFFNMNGAIWVDMQYFSSDTDEKNRAINTLRDALATLKWEIRRGFTIKMGDIV